MIQELVYTSAPRGLQPGKSGFCTVACTRGMTPNLFTMLESMSGYRHLSMECAPSPTVYSYHPISLGGRVWQVLSRISAYGLDYTQRANKLADHWVLDPSESVGRNAARLLQPSQNLLRSEWSGDPRWLPNPMPLPMPPPQVEHETKRCLHWKMVTGDEGWAGVLCDNAVSNRVTMIIVPPLFDILTLFEEALSLLPAVVRWQVSFSTYLTRLPPGVPCLWRGVVDGTPEADAARESMHTSANLVDLCRPLPALSTTGLESSLYVQQARSVNAPRVLVSSSPLVSDVDDSFPPPDPSFIRVNAGTQEFSGPITGVTNAPPHNPVLPLRDGISSRLEPTSSSGDGYESVPERPNLAAAACSPNGYAASRQKIFGVAPELPAVAKSKRRRENWIVGMLLVGFLLGVGGGFLGIWWFEFRLQKEDVTQEPAAAVVSQKPADEPQKSAPEPTPQKLAPPESAPPKPDESESAPPESASPESAPPKPDEPEPTPPESAPPKPDEPESTPPESAPPKPDEPESASPEPLSPQAVDAPAMQPPSDGTNTPKLDAPGPQTNPAENEKQTDEKKTPDSEGGDSKFSPEVFVFFKKGEGQATRIEMPSGLTFVTCEEGYTGPICKLTRVVITEKKDKGGEAVTDEEWDEVRDVSPLFEIKGGYLYPKQPLDYETFEENYKKENYPKKDGPIQVSVPLDGQSLPIAIKDVDFNKEIKDKNNTNNKRSNDGNDGKKIPSPFPLEWNPIAPQDMFIVLNGTLVCINKEKAKVGEGNTLFAEPVGDFPKLSIKSNCKKLTWNCGKEWPSGTSDTKASVDIAFECTNSDGVLSMSSVGSHSFTFEEDGSIHMGNTVLRPNGFKTITLTVNGTGNDTMTINGLTADTTITSSSGTETVVTAKETLQFKTLEKNKRKKLEGFNHELTITRNK